MGGGRKKDSAALTWEKGDHLQEESSPAQPPGFHLLVNNGWLPFAKADVNLAVSKEMIGDWHCVRYDAIWEGLSLDESKILANKIRKNIKSCTC